MGWWLGTCLTQAKFDEKSIENSLEVSLLGWVPLASCHQPNQVYLDGQQSARVRPFSYNDSKIEIHYSYKINGRNEKQTY